MGFVALFVTVLGLGWPAAINTDIEGIVYGTDNVYESTLDS